MPRGDCFVAKPPRNDESPARAPSLRASRQAGGGNPLSEPRLGAGGRLLRRKASSQRRIPGTHCLCEPAVRQAWQPPLGGNAWRGGELASSPSLLATTRPRHSLSLRVSRQAGGATPSRRQRSAPRGDCFVAKPPRNDESPALTVFASQPSGGRGNPLSEATRGAEVRLLRRKASSQRRLATARKTPPQVRGRSHYRRYDASGRVGVTRWRTAAGPVCSSAQPGGRPPAARRPLPPCCSRRGARGMARRRSNR